MFDEIRCDACCTSAVMMAGCTCWDYDACISDPGFMDHMREVHGDMIETHVPVPDSYWMRDGEYHWHNCRLCDDPEHRTGKNTHSYREDGICDVCGYKKPGGVEISGSISGGNNEGTIFIQLVSVDVYVPTIEITIDGDSTSYKLPGIVPGKYMMRVIKKDHAPVEKFVEVKGDEGDAGLFQDIRLRMYGDFSDDGKVNITDMFMFKSYFSGQTEFTEDQKAVADIDVDGKISLSDLFNVKGYLLNGKYS